MSYTASNDVFRYFSFIDAVSIMAAPAQMNEIRNTLTPHLEPSDIPTKKTFNNFSPDDISTIIEGYSTFIAVV